MSASKANPAEAKEAEFVRLLTELVARSRDDESIDLIEVMESIVSIADSVPRSLVSRGLH